jgi:hypothetical protein
MSMLRIGTCSFCGTGNVGIRVAASAQCLVGMCDECDAVWVDRKLQDGPHFPPQPDLPCPVDGSSLRNAPAHWASRAEASAFGWDEHVIDETVTIG